MVYTYDKPKNQVLAPIMSNKKKKKLMPPIALWKSKWKALW